MRVFQDEPQTVGGLIKDLRDEGILLFRQEVALAKKELAENTARTGKTIAFLAAGAFLAFCGILILLAALSIVVAVIFQALGMQGVTAVWAGPGLVGLITVLIGAIICLKALNALKRNPITPGKTIDSLKEEREWVRENIGR